MARLEDIAKDATVKGILANAAVKIIDAKPIGPSALKIVYEGSDGTTDQEILYRDREPTLELVESGRPWSFTGDGNLFRLVSEAQRIQLAYLFDPVLAVHTSLVEPLPHHGFAYAQDFDADRNRYVGLCGGRNTQVAADHTSLVVKPDIASTQLAAAATATAGTGTTTGNAGLGGAAGTGTITTGGTEPPETVKQKPKRFYGSVTLNATRLGRDAGRISEEILSHLASLQGAKAEVTLDIEVKIPEGVPDTIVRTVTENCRTLKFDSQGFEGE